MSVAVPSGGLTQRMVRAQTWRWPLFWMVLLTAITILIQSFNPGVSDISWLLVVGDRMLHGERLYVDIIEVNPPASVMLYMPALLVERCLGIRAEYAVIALTASGLMGSVWSAGRLLIRHDLLKEPAAAAFAALLAFGVIAGNSYAQREHIALIALLPLFALTACRAARAQVACSRAGVLAIGLAAGCAVAIKPEFAFPIVGVQTFAACCNKSLRPFFRTENLIILAVSLLYLCSTFLYFPGFWKNAFPILLQTYLPARLPMPLLLFVISPFLILTIAYIWFAKVGNFTSVQAVSLVAGAGFFVGCLQQGKGWAYHYYPAAALFLFVLVYDVLREAYGNKHLRREYRDLRITLAIVLLAVCVIRFLPHKEVSYSLEPAIRGVAAHPRILSITADLGISNPLTRRVGGTYVGTTASQWITADAEWLLRRRDLPQPDRARLYRLISRDREILGSDLIRTKPDVVLVDLRKNWGDWRAWARADAQLCAGLSRYSLRAANDDVALFVRDDLPGAGKPAIADGASLARVRGDGCGRAAHDQVIRR